jgi:hypothetical protein
MKADATEIDLEKLHAALRMVRNQDLFFMLDDALERLSSEDLDQVVRPYLDLERLRRAEPADGASGFADRVRAFADATRAGEYYESFDVNSRNYTELSRGTLAWIAAHRRLLDRCVAEAGKGDGADLLAAMDLLFGLLQLIDECGDEVLFFADEGGSWQVGVDWKQVLPAWLRVLSQASDPEGFAAAVVERHRRLQSYDRVGLFELAEKLATQDQAAALAARVVAAKPPGSGGGP